MNTVKLRQIIKEAIMDRLKMIDEAGDKAAINAKIAKIEEDIKEAQEIMSAIPENITHYAAPEIVSDLKDDLQASIDELEKKKEELNNQLTEMDKPAKTAAKKSKSSKKDDLKEFGPKPGLAKKQFMDALKEKGISLEDFLKDPSKHSKGLKALYDAVPKSQLKND